MNKIIKTAKDFQYSVNISYDIQNVEKLKGFIPTKSSLELLEEILLSTERNATNRSRILIGAYGKGKSHIVLTILSILKHHEPISDFVHLNKKLAENPRLSQIIQNYYESGKKLLPVLIGGSGTSLSQSFLVSLKNTLNENGLSDFMPESNYKAAVRAIQKWQKDFPEVLARFEEISGARAEDFISELADFNIDFYHQFEEIYPSLTAGSVFNPFLGFDVVELYEGVAKELRRQKLYDGLYVVYDEFSKYLESNIESASVSDTKMLQDFAEKCCRSLENQLHLLLISHKEIANYIDRLPKQKTDGWCGISERFEHILLNNNFSQVYEIISTVIQKDESLWRDYQNRHKILFEQICGDYKNHELFSEFRDSGGIKTLFLGTFPLHPVSTFILPRLSERIAQNERTLFTFLSAKGEATLPSFLEHFDDKNFSLVTPDLIFDYFEPLFKKEIFSGELHEIYHLTSVILEKLGGNSADSENVLEKKVIKSISLIYILAQFEKLKPVAEEIVRIYSYSYTKEEIESALKNLIEKEFVIYLRQSNSYLKLKETSGVDIAAAISDEAEKQRRDFSLVKVLNANNDERYVYPYRYNDEKEMTRYFEFRFVCHSELVLESRCFDAFQTKSDGVIFGIICKNSEEIESAKEMAKTVGGESCRFVFAIPKNSEKIEDFARKLSAVQELQKRASDDEILFSECQVVLDDVRQVVSSYIKNFTHPEKNAVSYFYGGNELKIHRRSELTALLSEICSKIYANSPVINNEAINKNEITSMAYNSRRKILAGLLRNPLEKNLGLTGSGQDVAIMRSTLLHTGFLKQNEDCENAELDFDFAENGDTFVLKPMICEIKSFAETAVTEKKNFLNLYEKLTLPEFGIGARNGIIPIFVAAVFGQMKNQLVLYHGERQIPLNADNLAVLNENPEEFFLLRFALDDDKKSYLNELKHIFSVRETSDFGKNEAETIFSKMQDWYLSLSKYSREKKTQFSVFLKIFKENYGAQEALFEKIPQSFGEKSANFETAQKINNAKSCYDNLISDLKAELSAGLNRCFAIAQHDGHSAQNASHFERSEESQLQFLFNAWLKNQNPKVKTHLFSDGTERFIAVLQKEFESEGDFIEELAFTATDLRLCDWSENTKSVFERRISEWKKTAEEFTQKENLRLGGEKNDSLLAKNAGGENASEKNTNLYSVSFPQNDGKAFSRSFEKITESPRARVLYNKLTDALDTMGQSMSEAEKRQVVMDVLQKMCGGAE